ncbi:polysaccharide deacetylase family protein [Micromonospora sp. NPDC000089]|uniref:polysaccharide deacetylase family protein n=1 Tax=unclassified Micromonospora TaxID=2617518 RepID=UPI00369F383D
MRAALTTVATATAVGAVAQSLPAVTAHPAVRRRLWPALSGLGPADRIALTFDDGPDRASTPLFLRELERARVRATFFLLGDLVDADPGLARELAAAGHEVAVHGWEHRNLLGRSPAATYADIARARDRITAASGAAPVWYRPPYGVLTTAALLACRRLGLTPRLWTVWGRDWEADRTPESIWRTLARDLDGGGTVLLHDSDRASTPGAWRGALAVLPRLVDWAAGRGLSIGTLGAHQAAAAGRPTRRPGMVVRSAGKRRR